MKQGILIIMIMCLLMMPMMSPIKVTFSVTTMSILTSMSAYSTSLAIFPSSGIIISFSSGMMILFCYCAMMTKYEKKNYNKKVMITATMIIASMVMITSSKENTMNNTSAVMMNLSPFLVTAMGVIIISMVCINKAMFTPTKSLISSY